MLLVIRCSYFVLSLDSVVPNVLKYLKKKKKKNKCSHHSCFLAVNCTSSSVGKGEVCSPLLCSVLASPASLGVIPKPRLRDVLALIAEKVEVKKWSAQWWEVVRLWSQKTLNLSPDPPSYSSSQVIWGILANLPEPRPPLICKVEIVLPSQGC